MRAELRASQVVPEALLVLDGRHRPVVGQPALRRGRPVLEGALPGGLTREARVAVGASPRRARRSALDAASRPLRRARPRRAGAGRSHMWEVSVGRWLDPTEVHVYREVAPE